MKNTQIKNKKMFKNIGEYATILKEFNEQKKPLIIHALIPARGGSKSIPKKNIKKYKGFPLLVYSIQAAKKVKEISKVIVSTDTQEIKQIAKKYGAEVPFLRPNNISGDLSTDLECFQQYLHWLKFTKKEIPDIIVHLRPTYPERNNMIITDCLKKFVKVRNEYSSLRTVVPIEKSLFKMYTLDGNTLEPTYKKFNNINEPYNQVRQILPTTYLHNGCIDIINTKTILNNSMTGEKIYAYVMPEEETYDIDTKEDWLRSMRKKNPNKTLEEELLEITGCSENISQSEKHSNPIKIPRRKIS